MQQVNVVLNGTVVDSDWCQHQLTWYNWYSLWLWRWLPHWGCQNVSHRQQQSYSRLHVRSPGQSCSTYLCINTLNQKTDIPMSASLQKHRFLLALRRWGCPQQRRARRNRSFRRLNVSIQQSHLTNDYMTTCPEYSV